MMLLSIATCLRFSLCATVLISGFLALIVLQTDGAWNRVLRRGAMMNSVVGASLCGGGGVVVEAVKFL